MSLERFDRLHVKLFLVIAGAIAGLTVVTYLVFTWSFERGFVQYVTRADDARLELMTDRLADVYAREGGFTALAADTNRCFKSGMFLAVATGRIVERNPKSGNCSEWSRVSVGAPSPVPSPPHAY